jgi:hypothetical protein
MSPRVRAAVVLGIALLPGLTAVRAQVEVRLSPIGDRGLALVDGPRGYRLENAAGAFQELEVPAGVGLTAVRELSDGWIVAGTILSDEQADLLLIRESEGMQTVIEAPGSRVGRSRRGPVPLVERGSLVGVAWLEGDDRERNAVRAAGWNGDSWGEAEEVSPVGDQAQLALDGAVLGDGGWLLVWAAVDGEDEEIVWSRRSAGDWSEARRLHRDNGVPDIVPRVVGVPGGALAAWSRSDGSDYRLKLALFDGEEWIDSGFKGERGSLFPDLVSHDTGATVLYKTVLPPTWSFLDVDRGRIRRRAAIERVGSQRPLIESRSGSQIILRFPGVLPSAGLRGSVPWENQP